MPYNSLNYVLWLWYVQSINVMRPWVAVTTLGNIDFNFTHEFRVLNNLINKHLTICCLFINQVYSTLKLFSSSSIGS